MNTKLLKTLRGVGKAGLILTVMLCVALFCGCAGEVAGAVARENDPGEGGIAHELGTFEGLSAETEKRILQDYFVYPFKDMRFADGFKIHDYRICGYFGIYNDYVMVGVRIDEEILRERVFSYPGVALYPVVIDDWYYKRYFYYEPTIAWKDGQLYKVADLYKAGNLTLNDLRNIAKLNPEWKPISELR